MARQDKVAQALKKEISNIIHEELKDPRLGFVTLTKVELSRDLRFAKVFFSVLGNQQEYKNTQRALDSAAGFIKRLVCERVRMRFAPEFIFRQDHSTEYSVRIEEVLNQIKEEQDAAKKSHRRAKKK